MYIPATVAMLRELSANGELAAIGGTAFALTPALRESYATGGDEELEYAAMLDAARASLRLLGAELERDPEALMRRAVVSADVDGAELRSDLDYAVVKLAGPVQLKVVAAIHLDTEEAQDAVRDAVAAVDAADLGDPDAEFVLGEAEDHELAWYAAQELPFVLELL
ncbi:hypothetical protein CLV40_103451 [Actinokineospora auranticolor]|uniref:Uncharacterized protein n=1 Tax=Actinokineospora auranticolor TaxID=155976 RepID=A0A2S6GXF0_9PSEU|nr:hypothetical protein CLV40_103451 [Actinokineospora auranticolor]